MIEFNRTGFRQGPGSNRISNWMPIHQAIVMDYISGLNHSQIAEKYNYTESWVCQVITTKQGKALIAEVQNRVLEEKFGNISDQRKADILLVREKIRSFLQNDELQTKAPLACVMPNIKILEVLTNEEKPLAAAQSNVTYNTQVNVMSSPEKRDALSEGLRRAQMVEVQHAAVTGASVDGAGSKEVKEIARLLK